VQIEALPTLAEGEARARAYGGVFPNVAGFELVSGWYAIVLGPFTPDEAVVQLGLLRSEGMIPADSYIPDPVRFERRFWPAGATDAVTGTTAEPAPTDPPATDEPAAEAAPAPEALLPDESPREARLSESALPEADRQLLQTALQWEGFYAGKIDGAIGAGTRASMAAWQVSRGFDETGILTTRQRAQLIEEYQADVASIGLAPVTEAKAGIEISLPLSLVDFAGYQPPFVQYGEKDGSGFQALLISQQGDETTLFGLYDLMQSLEIVPLQGERERQRTSFVINGDGAGLRSYTQATLEGGFIKGFTLAWDPAQDERAARVLEAMKASFRAVGDQALDDSLGAPLEVSRDTLLAGLEVRKPRLSRSGFYVDPQGSVLTTSDAVATCGRITLDGQIEVDVKLSDAAGGFAVLTPRTPLAPRAHAGFRTSTTRNGAEIAVAGYPYEDALSSPVVTFGAFAEARGLNGEAGLSRLTLTTLPGDAGGPVIDSSGSVVGMLLPAPESKTQVLPADVAFARSAAALAEALTLAGLAPTPSTQTGAIAAEDVARIGRDMTVLVSCWD
jgi:peptidoglycan hydrolase-like protein with peptidoglycan-binding domain